MTPHRRRTLLWVALAAVHLVAFARIAGVGEAFLAGSEFDPMAPQPRAIERALAEARYGDALPLAIELERIHPTQPLVSYWLALIHQGLDRPEDEAAAWETYLRNSRSGEDACPDIAGAYRRAGNDERAVAALQRCTELDSGEPERWLDLGDGLARIGDRYAALAAYRRGLELDPRHSILAARLESGAAGGGEQ